MRNTLNKTRAEVVTMKLWPLEMDPKGNKRRRSLRILSDSLPEKSSKTQKASVPNASQAS